MMAGCPPPGAIMNCRKKSSSGGKWQTGGWEHLRTSSKIMTGVEHWIFLVRISKCRKKVFKRRQGVARHVGVAAQLG